MMIYDSTPASKKPCSWETAGMSQVAAYRLLHRGWSSFGKAQKHGQDEDKLRQGGGKARKGE